MVDTVSTPSEVRNMAGGNNMADTDSQQGAQTDNTQTTTDQTTQTTQTDQTTTTTTQGEQGGQGDNQGGQEELIAGKFKSTEDLVNAYKELEKQFHQMRQGDSQGQPQDQTQEQQPQTQDQPQDQTQDQTQEQTQEQQTQDQQSQVSLRDVVNKYLSSGQVSESDYQALESQGITRDMVDMQLQGASQIQQQAETTAYQIAGGKEQYQAMIQWAANNVTKAQQHAYDRAVNSGDLGQVEMAVRALVSKYQEANGKVPSRSLSSQGTPADTQGDVYQSWQEVMRDMKDPAYKRDHAFRQKVEDRLARSRI